MNHSMKILKAWCLLGGTTCLALDTAALVQGAIHVRRQQATSAEVAKTEEEQTPLEWTACYPDCSPFFRSNLKIGAGNCKCILGSSDGSGEKKMNVTTACECAHICKENNAPFFSHDDQRAECTCHEKQEEMKYFPLFTSGPSCVAGVDFNGQCNSKEVQFDCHQCNIEFSIFQEPNEGTQVVWAGMGYAEKTAQWEEHMEKVHELEVAAAAYQAQQGAPSPSASPTRRLSEQNPQASDLDNLVYDVLNPRVGWNDKYKPGYVSEAGHLLRKGRPNGANCELPGGCADKCGRDHETAAVRCCRDSPLSGYSIRHNAGNTFYTQSPDCAFIAKTFMEAKTRCDQDSARLCTGSEVDEDDWAMDHRDGIGGTGCGFDNYLVWTDDMCYIENVPQTEAEELANQNAWQMVSSTRRRGPEGVAGTTRVSIQEGWPIFQVVGNDPEAVNFSYHLPGSHPHDIIISYDRGNRIVELLVNGTRERAMYYNTAQKVRVKDGYLGCDAGGGNSVRGSLTSFSVTPGLGVPETGTGYFFVPKHACKPDWRRASTITDDNPNGVSEAPENATSGGGKYFGRTRNLYNELTSMSHDARRAVSVAECRGACNAIPRCTSFLWAKGLTRKQYAGSLSKCFLAEACFKDEAQGSADFDAYFKVDCQSLAGIYSQNVEESDPTAISITQSFCSLRFDFALFKNDAGQVIIPQEQDSLGRGAAVQGEIYTAVIHGELLQRDDMIVWDDGTIWSKQVWECIEYDPLGQLGKYTAWRCAGEKNGQIACLVSSGQVCNLWNTLNDCNYARQINSNTLTPSAPRDLPYHGVEELLDGCLRAGLCEAVAGKAQATANCAINVSWPVRNPVLFDFIGQGYGLNGQMLSGCHIDIPRGVSSELQGCMKACNYLPFPCAGFSYQTGLYKRSTDIVCRVYPGRCANATGLIVTDDDKGAWYIGSLVWSTGAVKVITGSENQWLTYAVAVPACLYGCKAGFNKNQEIVGDDCWCMTITSDSSGIYESGIGSACECSALCAYYKTEWFSYGGFEGRCYCKNTVEPNLQRRFGYTSGVTCKKKELTDEDKLEVKFNTTAGPSPLQALQADVMNTVNDLLFSCFPGEATVNVHGQGRVPLAQVRKGDLVRVERNEGQYAYEPILGFLHELHAKSGTHQFLTVTHARGEFRASASHLVFVVNAGSRQSKLVGSLEVGDELLVADGDNEKPVPSDILGIQHGLGNLGMYAPLTASGVIVVDDVIASNYAAPSPDLYVPHSTAHAVMFPLRLYYRFFQGDVAASKLHPFVGFLYRSVGLGKFHKVLTLS